MGKICLIAYLVLLLFACDEYPGLQQNDAVKISPKPTWGDLISQEIPLGGDCHIDSVNGEPGEGLLSHSVTRSESALKVSGWGAISVNDGVIASDTAIALRSKSPQGTRFYAATSKEKRQDVADHFKNQASVDTGFIAVVDLSDVSPGEYVLEVIQHKDGRNLKCRYTANIVVVK